MAISPNSQPLITDPTTTLTLEQRTAEYFKERRTIISDTMPENRNQWTLPGTEERMPVAIAAKISMVVAGRIAKVSE